MPVESSFRALLERKLGPFPHFLIYIFLEWIMIVLLFIDGLLAFVSNEFAKFFELKIPCLLCTRIDHVLVHRNSSFYYNDSICDHHKKDISSLAYCHMHKKLSDIRSMCQGCLLSFATGKDSDCDKYKSLVGILHKDVDCFLEEERKLLMKPSKKDDQTELSNEKSGSHRCSCCGEPLKLRSSSKYVRSLSMNGPTPSPRASWLSSNKNEDGRNVEMPHVKYTELKLMSDSESEVPEDDASNVDNQGKEDTKSASLPLDPEDINEDTNKTPSFTRGNRFFGIPLDSAQLSPRWVNYRGIKKQSADPAEQSDLSGVNDVDGEILSRLKRQVRLDHKSLMALYMELDEERSASAVAANNAMAMITRLQAEKAAVQMEAQQYQRMMEEQAEYDEEALQVMRDMLLKREDDIKALESELELYREKYGLIKRVGSEICEVDADDDYQEIKSHSFSSFSEKSDSGSFYGGDQYENDHQEESCLDFESERSYLLGLLVDLERKMKSEISIVKDGDDQGRGNKTKATLTREVSLIKERLRAIEADSGFLKHAAMTLQRGGEGTKLLTEIAQHLRKLRQSVKSPSDDSNV
ncbi:hypothetical protein CDL12_04639 [Handroanthus impetiginosus]|uniref:GTD-binding domain-containing protein n=1 Tax=Handroanthus impetiginosus TaxID=429701 RepID=A0A2G9HYQ8_9LAMI|nr:hypothetical protein CDL12_04639 [Handroanthus impetiginosus]